MHKAERLFVLGHLKAAGPHIQPLSADTIVAMCRSLSVCTTNLPISRLSWRRMRKHGGCALSSKHILHVIFYTRNAPMLLSHVMRPCCCEGCCGSCVESHEHVARCVWQEEQEEKHKFKLTDDIQEKNRAREEEEKRVQEALTGTLSHSHIGGSGSNHDEF